MPTRASHSIINHRNMSALYSWWIVAVVSSVATAGLAYAIQHGTPFFTERPAATWIALTSVGGVLLVWAGLFKYAFKNEYIAWLFAWIIGVFGLVCMLVYGWNWLFTIFFGVNILAVMALGPYLYFD